MRLRAFLTPLVLLLMGRPRWGRRPCLSSRSSPASDIESGLLKLPDPVELGVTSRTLLFESIPRTRMPMA
ncbi:MAG: hypothetical protein R3B67_13205 [Phycisphaerales bacterium]